MLPNSIHNLLHNLPFKVPGIRHKDSNFLYWITFGHIVMHWYQNLFPLILPYFKSEFGLSAVQLASLNTVQMGVASGLMVVVAYFTDTRRNIHSIFLVSAILLLGLSYFAISVLPTYAWTLIWSGLIGLSVALWHPTAMGSLSIKFSKKRGMALGVHGVGASIGDAISPIIVGALIMTFAWRTVLQFHLIPILIICVVMWRVLSKNQINKQNLNDKPAHKKISHYDYWADLKTLVRNPQALSVTISNALISGARVSVLTFLPIYLFDTLGFSSLKMGVYLALLFAMGIISQPIMGVLSDRIGRKAILIPSFLILGILYLSLAITQNEILLGLIIGVLGAFFYPILNIAQAAIMDVGSKDIQSTTMGFSGLVGWPAIIVSPIFAGLLVDKFTIEVAFIFAGIIALVSCLILIPIKFTPPIDFED
ncbi:MAG: MFS transporter, FSR family, fosmidomycin resistance protein [Chloroflexi bacterium]|jgi:sugar phosphate permease|nr:MAG: MFS transporter, FSR family, fosmidomycin resistance protein [Chloroflexota bacterium]